MISRFFIFISFFILLCGLQLGLAQSYPPYKLTVIDSSSKGFYFFCPAPGGNGKKVEMTQMILDRNGKMVYFKDYGTKGSSDFCVWPNGLMSYSYLGKFYFMDSTFSTVDSIVVKNGLTSDTHDMQLLPNGHYLLMGTENLTMDLSSYHYFNHNGSPGSKTATVTSGVIQELDANKNVVLEWHAKDHYAFNDVDSLFMSSPTNVDWTHLNAVCFDNDSNILISARYFNEITKINRKDGSIIWRFGGKRNQFKFLNDTIHFIGQHDIRRIANGNITLYDNGRGGVPLHPATAREYKLDDKLYTANLVWSYVNNPNSVSGATGNVQRLANGNTLVDYGSVNNENLVFNVINPSGSKVFEIAFQDTLGSYRSFNYFELPFWLHRPVLTCFSSQGKYYLDAGAGHGKYIWSNGDTTQTVQVQSNDTLSVYVPVGKDGNGGLIRSVDFIVSPHTNPCNPAGINPNVITNQYSIYPNPVVENLIIESPLLNGQMINCQVFDLAGRKLKEVYLEPLNGRTIVPVNDLVSGIYFLNINGWKEKFVKE